MIQLNYAQYVRASVVVLGTGFEQGPRPLASHIEPSRLLIDGDSGGSVLTLIR